MNIATPCLSLFLSLSSLLAFAGCPGAPVDEPGEGEGEAAAGLPCGTGGTLAVDFNRSCADASDCSIVEVTVDCCGTKRFLGIANSAFDGVQGDADECAAGWPDCACLPEAPVADDGSSATFGTPAVRCVDGPSCETTFEF